MRKERHKECRFGTLFFIYACAVSYRLIWENQKSICTRAGDFTENLRYVLPVRISEMLFQTPRDKLNTVSELRLRIGQPVIVRTGFTENGLGERGLQREPGTVFSAADALAFMTRINERSPYAHAQSMQSGFVTVRGGHRIGMGGQAVCSGGQVSGIVGQSCFCIRCAHEVKGCFEKIRSLVFTESVCSCLFFSLPGGGKTTMLRDCCRTLSREGYNVSLIDERNEIAACCAGVPTLDLGTRCDVLAGCPRSEGMMMALRTLAPDVIITDELGGEKDAEAVRDAINGGVAVIASAHAGSIEELKRRGYADGMGFERYVYLSRGAGGTAFRVYGQDMKPLIMRGGLVCCI